MKKIIMGLWMLLLCVFVSGCASIVDGRAKSVHINSNPPGAKFTIYDKDGKTVGTNSTPATLKLERSSGYFSGVEYRLVFEQPGYYPGEGHFTSNLDGWYFGNILLGGVIGMLIVDPLTGDMFTLPHEFNYTLVSTNTTLSPEELTAAQIKANQPKEHGNAEKRHK